MATRKNKRATRKNKRATRKNLVMGPDAELQRYEHINRYGKQVALRYNLCHGNKCQKISAKTFKMLKKKSGVMPT